MSKLNVAHMHQVWCVCFIVTIITIAQMARTVVGLRHLVSNNTRNPCRVVGLPANHWIVRVEMDAHPIRLSQKYRLLAELTNLLHNILWIKRIQITLDTGNAVCCIHIPATSANSIFIHILKFLVEYNICNTWNTLFLCRACERYFTSHHHKNSETIAKLQQLSHRYISLHSTFR